MLNPPMLDRSNRLVKQSLVAAMAVAVAFGLLVAPQRAQSRPSASQAETYYVTMTDNEFSPKYVQINVGDTVVWTNDGDQVHAVSDNAHLEESPDIPRGQTWQKTFTEEGYWHYHCPYHSGDHGFSGMVGTIIVGNPPQRSISLSASPVLTTFGKSVRLNGQVSLSDPRAPDCSDTVPVRLERDAVGEPEEFVEVASTTTSLSRFNFTRTADSSSNYRVVAEGVPECPSEVLSDVRTILVGKKVVLNPSSTRVAKGRRVTFKVVVKPCGDHAGQPVLLLKKRAGRFVKIADKASDASCSASFKQRIRRRSTYKARSPKTDGDHEAGKSAAKSVSVR